MEAPTTTTTELVVQDVSGSEIISDTKQFISTTTTAKPLTKTPAATTAEVTTTSAPTDQHIRSPTRNVFHILGKLPEGVSCSISPDTLGLNMKKTKKMW